MLQTVHFVHHAHTPFVRFFNDRLTGHAGIRGQLIQENHGRMCRTEIFLQRRKEKRTIVVRWRPKTATGTQRTGYTIPIFTGNQPQGRIGIGIIDTPIIDLVNHDIGGLTRGKLRLQHHLLGALHQQVVLIPRHHTRGIFHRFFHDTLGGTKGYQTLTVFLDPFIVFAVPPLKMDLVPVFLTIHLNDFRFVPFERLVAIAIDPITYLERIPIQLCRYGW